MSYESSDESALKMSMQTAFRPHLLWHHGCICWSIKGIQTCAQSRSRSKVLNEIKKCFGVD